MNKKLLISFLLFNFLFIKISWSKNNFYRKIYTDTTIIESAKEDKTIAEVVNSRTPPKKEKVEYVNQVTKYGFKNLFKNYSYNSAIPYSSQVNPYAETFMQDYLHDHGKYLVQMKKTALPYFNLIDGILVRYGLPRELKYLAVIESDLKADALSTAGARGPWQFMTYTAKDYGLRVNEYQDDRTDYFKSTNAAAKYLLNLYKDFNDWLLVIAAYNGGPARVYSAIKKSGSKNFWSLQYFLPEESRNHVKKFIATHYIMETNNDETEQNFDYTKLNNTSENNKPSISDSEALHSAEIELSGKYVAAIIAKNLDMDVSDFNRYNPGFDNEIARGNVYNLRLPNSKMDRFIADKYRILNECVEQLFGDVNLNTKTVYKKRTTGKKN